MNTTLMTKNFVPMRKNNFTILIVFLLVVFSLSKVSASVWALNSNAVGYSNSKNTEKMEWNNEWEKHYSFWVQKVLQTNWLQNERLQYGEFNPFYRWQVDCAKLAYLTRLFFSYRYGLEFVIRSDQGQLISSQDNHWDEEPNPIKRLKNFAKFILARVSTRTISRDSLLIDISRNSLIPGTLLVADSKRGHVMILKELKRSGAPIFIYSTLPASDFIYESYSYPTPEAYFLSGKNPSVSQGGFRRFLWPSEHRARITQRAPLKTPAPFQESLIQTELNLPLFFDEVQKKVLVAPLSENEKFEYLLDDLCMKMHERMNVIIDAALALENKKGKRFTEAEFDLYSTYRRDFDIMTYIQRLDQTYREKRYLLSPNNQTIYQQLLTATSLNDDFCLVPWADNKLESLGSLRAKFLAKKISSNPYDSFAKRWGE
ncbi:MAG: hypothetical protein L6Q37_06965 [Bdellovibrionaceae bacterium]|nr:hypothetical protein [Pseudobdellovibrionaceae bacterium]NUM57235.1 hypothetical protein [Pseudobdellovibrionaceae bacterium]